MRITSFLIGLALVFAFAMAPTQSMAQTAPKVISVMTYDVAGDMPKFVELYKRAMVIMEKYGSTGQSRLWMATYAGANAGRIAVAIKSVQLPTGSARTISGCWSAPKVDMVSTRSSNLQQKHAPGTSPTSKPCDRRLCVSTNP